MNKTLEALIADMKTAANKAKQANELYLEKKITLSECAIEIKDYLEYSDDPKNMLAVIAALEQAQQELIKPLAIGELIQRLENQTGEPWGKRFLEGFDISEGPTDGWVLVPETANITMIKAGGKAAREYMEECGGNSPQIIYRAMIAAAPKSGAK